MSNVIKPDSWDNLLAELFTDSWDNKLRRFRSPYVFRGLSDSDYNLETTLMRLGGNYYDMEHHLMRNFRKYAQKNDVPGDSFWHWLTVAQHHGLPTRLMDWTYSPLVALHFATANIENFDIDGAIWAVNYADAHQMLPNRLRDALNREGANAFTVDMLHSAAGSYNEFSNIQPEEDLVLFFEPHSIDERFVNQFALFSISSNPQLSLDDWFNNNSSIWRKIIISSKLKWEIRDKLDQSNITERVLFPGLDGLSDWLKRQYCPKGK